MNRRGKGIRLIRAGGLSPVRQARSAPERRGVWAFIWPYHELFLLGSTGPEGVRPKGETRIDLLLREGWTRFVHHGTLYTHLDVPHGIDIGKGWCRTDGNSLASYMSKFFALSLRSLRRDEGKGLYQNPHSVYTKDHFEVFVPRPDEGGF